MTQEELMAVLKDAQVEIHNEHEFGTLDDELNYGRTIEFSVGVQEYSITWFCNMCYLKVDGYSLQVNFTNVRHTGTWPNNYKRNLQFYYNGECIAVIGLEKY